MHVSFTPHKASFGGGSKNVMEYLDKENYLRESATESVLQEIEDLEQMNFDENLEKQNLFFSNNSDQGEEYFTQKEATDHIDNNLSNRAKENESKFFILNISPSKDELEHLQKLAEIELEQNGFGKKERELLEQTENGKLLMETMKNDLMHQLMREYCKEAMKQYAENFDRKVYQNPDKLPTQREQLEINREAKKELEAQGIDKKNPEYGEKLQEAKERLAEKIGKDLSTRKMTEKDLVWFGKIEQVRTYKANDKWVIDNKKTHKEIKEVEKNEKMDPKEKLQKISELRLKLHKDRATGEEVREGMKKGGLQYHAHIVVSRYDNCPNDRYRQSLSPMANHKNSKVANKESKVGFDRDKFFSKVEQTFDEKFKFQREKSYENYKEQKKAKSNSKSSNLGESIMSSAVAKATAEVKQSLGLNELSKLNIKSTVSKELGFSVPLSVPKTPADMAMKTIRTIINKIQETSKGY